MSSAINSSDQEQNSNERNTEELYSFTFRTPRKMRTLPSSDNIIDKVRRMDQPSTLVMFLSCKKTCKVNRLNRMLAKVEKLYIRSDGTVRAAVIHIRYKAGYLQKTGRLLKKLYPQLTCNEQDKIQFPFKFVEHAI